MRQILSDLHSIQSKLYHPGIFGFTKRSPIFRVAAGRGEPLNARRWFALLGSVVRSVGSFLTGNGARASRGRELRARISGKKGGRACALGCTKYTAVQNIQLTGQNRRSRSQVRGISPSPPKLGELTGFFPGVLTKVASTGRNFALSVSD